MGILCHTDVALVFNKYSLENMIIYGKMDPFASTVVEIDVDFPAE
jgi:hypothetical protein